MGSLIQEHHTRLPTTRRRRGFAMPALFMFVMFSATYALATAFTLASPVKVPTQILDPGVAAEEAAVEADVHSRLRVHLRALQR